MRVGRDVLSVLGKVVSRERGGVDATALRTLFGQGSVIDSGMVCSKDAHLSGRGTMRAEDTRGTPTQSHASSSILAYENNIEKQSGERLVSKESRIQ